MIEISILFGIYILVSSAIIRGMQLVARDERKELEDRIMALSKPESVATYKAIRDEEPAQISYVDDEERLPEFKPSTILVED